MGSRKRFLPALTLVMLLSFLVPLLPASKAYAIGQSLFWSQEGNSFTTFAPNSPITIDWGTISFMPTCTSIGTPDFMYPWADVYIVPSGFLGGKLEDVGGSANTIGSAVSSGVFARETIGYAAPGGKIPPGRYAVVYDECQDGYFHLGIDALFDPAFEVLGGPVDAPALPWMEHVKESAGELNELFAKANKNLKKILKKGKVEIEVPKWDASKLFVRCDYGSLCMSPVWGAVNNLANLTAYYKSIADDPPDPNFAQVTTLAVHEAQDPQSNDPLDVAMAGLGTAAGNEWVLAEALLHSLERYQGADAAQNGEWALVHARATQQYARALAAQLPVTGQNLSAMRNAFATDPRPIDETFALYEANRARIVASGFTDEEIREARTLGVTQSQLDALRAELATEDYAFTRAELLQTLDALLAEGSAMAGALNQLAADMESIVATLKANPNVVDYGPMADAGGPYTGAEGESITLTAAASAGPGTNTAYAWDLDGDGAFDDATGVTVAFTLPRDFAGLVGVKVSNSLGRSAVAYAQVSAADVDRRPVVESFTPAATHAEVMVDSSLDFSVTASDPEGAPVTVTWYVNGAAAGTGPAFTYTPAAAGMQTIRAMVSDGSPLGGSVTLTWHVAARQPDPGLEPTAAFIPQGAGRNVAMLEAGATVIASSGSYWSTTNPQAMLNELIDDPWMTSSAAATSGWVKLQLAGGKTYLIDRIRLMPGKPGATGTAVTERVKDFEVAVSTTTADDGAFTTVLTGTAADNTELQEFVLPEPVLAKYVRYRILSNRGARYTTATMQFKVMTSQEGDGAVTFRDRSTDPDNDIVAWAWDFGDGSTSAEQNPTHTFPGAGAYNVTLTVTDRGGNTSSYTQVQRVFTPPAASFRWSPAVGLEGLGIIFTDTSTDPDGGTIVRWDWSWGDGTNGNSGTSKWLYHTYHDNGIYTATLTVTDVQGLSTTIQQQVTVTNRPPYGRGGFDQTTAWGVPIKPDAYTHDPSTIDESTLQCRWEMGDGGVVGPGPCAAAAIITPEYAYSKSGTYTRVLTVTDKDGGKTNLSSVVTVTKRGADVSFQGPRTASGGAPVTLQARLRDLTSAGPVAGRQVTFTVAGQTLTATTDASGIATATLADVAPGDYLVRLQFAGDEDYTGYSDVDRLLVGLADDALVNVSSSLSATECACEDPVTVSLNVTGTAPTAQTVPQDIALVIDVSGSMAGDRIVAARQAARSFVRILDRESDGVQDGIIRGSRIAVIPFNYKAWLGMPLSSDATALDLYISKLGAGDSTNIADGIKVGQAELLAGRKPGNKPFMIVMSDGESDRAAAQSEAASAKAAGTELFSIGLGTGADQATLRSIASDPLDAHYFFSPGSAELEQIYAHIARTVTGPAATDVAVTAEVSEEFTLDPAAIQPAPASVSGNVITWLVPALKDETLTFSYQVTSATGGTKQVNRSASVAYTDTKGARVTLAFDPMSVLVDCPVADDVAPVTTIQTEGSRGQDDWWTSAVQVTLTATDMAGEGGTVSGVELTEYSLDGGATWLPYSGPFSLTAQGLTEILARSTDKAGNQEQTPAQAAVRIDSESPVLVDGGPYSGPEGSIIAFDAEASSDATSGVAMIQWDLDGDGALETDGPTASYLWTDNGIHQVTIKVIDRAGNQAIGTVQANVVNVAPAVSGPAALTQYWGLPVEFAGGAADPGQADLEAGLTAAWVFGDGSAPASEFTASHSFEIPGAYTATLSVTDKDGGSGAHQVAVTVAKRPSSLIATDSTTTFGSGATLTAQLSDGVDPGTASLVGRLITFTVGGVTLTAVTDANGLATATAPAQLMPGAHPVQVTFSEDAYYLAASAAGHLTVSNTAGKVTAGTFETSGKGRGGFNLHSDGASIQGQLQFQNDSIKLHAARFTAFGLSADGRSAWFAGVGRDGETFIAYAEDNGEPGDQDRFQLWVNGQQITTDGSLSGGNIQTH